jgi:hypothetical protein
MQWPPERTGIVGDNRQVTIVMHAKPWAGWPGGEPQSVRDAYDELLAEKGELWPPAEGGARS